MPVGDVLADLLRAGRERVLELAVKRMLPGGPLKRQQMTHLKIYAGAAHPHDAQNPQKLDIKSMNPKNAVRG